MPIIRSLLTAPDRPRPTALLPPRSYGKPEAAAAVDRLLMMGIRMPETCGAVFKRQTINLQLIAASSWLIHLNGCVTCRILEGNLYSVAEKFSEKPSRPTK